MLGDVLKKIEVANAKRDKAVSSSLRARLGHNRNMLMALTMLLEHHTMKEIQQSNMLCRSAFFNYKKQLRDLGVTSDGRLTTMPPPTLDYVDYQHYFGHKHLT